MLKQILCIFAMIATLVLTGCIGSKSNNHKSMEELADFLIDRGIPVTAVQPVAPEAFKAMRAFAFQIDNGLDIGVYQYDLNNNRMREILTGYKDASFAYVEGIKFQAWVEGSFMILGLEKNPHRAEIEAAFKEFY